MKFKCTNTSCFGSQSEDLDYSYHLTVGKEYDIAFSHGNHDCEIAYIKGDKGLFTIKTSESEDLVRIINSLFK